MQKRICLEELKGSLKFGITERVIQKPHEILPSFMDIPRATGFFMSVKIMFILAYDTYPSLF